jgi:hypothetical protein
VSALTLAPLSRICANASIELTRQRFHVGRWGTPDDLRLPSVVLQARGDTDHREMLCRFAEHTQR